jgi:hypothetical protein
VSTGPIVPTSYRTQRDESTMNLEKGEWTNRFRSAGFDAPADR